MDSTGQPNPPNPPGNATPLWLKRLPMVTGLLAGLAGFLTVRSANMSNQAIYKSNQAILHQSLASDQWEEYQADSVKRHVDENSMRIGVTDPVARKTIEDEIKSLQTRQVTTKLKAEDETQLRVQELQNGSETLATKDMLDYAGVGAQLGIALASVAALTKKQAAFHVGLFAGAIAVAVTGYAIITPYLVRFFAHH